MDEPTQEQPRKKGGWPKGKPRGPRKHPVPTEPDTPPPAPRQEPPKAFTEPVEATVVYKTGQVSTFESSEFDISGPEYRFISYPEKRGHKILHIFQKSEIAAVSVMAPVAFFDKVPPAKQVDAAAPSRRDDSDPRTSLSPGHPRARNTQGPGGIPQSVIIGPDGVPEVHAAGVVG